MKQKIGKTERSSNWSSGRRNDHLENRKEQQLKQWSEEMIICADKKR